MKKNNMNLLERIKAPTSKFFRVVRNAGLCLAAAGGAILAAPVSLPLALVTAGGYLVVAGSVMTAVAQATVDQE